MVGWHVESRSGSAALGGRLDKLDHTATLSLAGLAALGTFESQLPEMRHENPVIIYVTMRRCVI